MVPWLGRTALMLNVNKQTVINKEIIPSPIPLGHKVSKMWIKNKIWIKICEDTAENVIKNLWILNPVTHFQEKKTYLNLTQNFNLQNFKNIQSKKMLKFTIKPRECIAQVFKKVCQYMVLLAYITLCLCTGNFCEEFDQKVHFPHFLSLS